MTHRRPEPLWRSFRSVAAFAFVLTAWSLRGAEFDWKLPPGFPRPVVPANNPMSAAKVEVGRYLFYDKRMSGNGKQSCGSCHRQELAFTDGLAHARGSTGEVHPRSSMSLVNVAYAPRLTWANPTLDSLEEQALTPMLGEHPIELGLKGHEGEFLSVLRRDPLYQRLFAEAFPVVPSDGRDVYTLDRVTKAIAAFERAIVSMRSPYDRYRWGGDSTALSESAKRGELIFFSSERGGCFQCHGGWNFSAVSFEDDKSGQSVSSRDGIFFNTGVSRYAEPNRGLFERTGAPQDVGRFRAPTLRNIAVTAPYMHDGSMTTLAQVVDHYAAGGVMPHANQSRLLRPLPLSAHDKSDLIEFLESLTDQELLRDSRWKDPWSIEK